MPTYDYRCDAAGRTVEVRHPMNARPRTWGELRMLAGLGPDDVPADAPIERLLTAGHVVRSDSLGSGAAPPCATGPCCGGGACGLN